MPLFDHDGKELLHGDEVLCKFNVSQKLSFNAKVFCEISKNGNEHWRVQPDDEPDFISPESVFIWKKTDEFIFFT